ncbi:MAG TPA: hypothetical protein DEV75_12715 [Desulfovibrio sp.]|jgi:hypothetical protein|nr:hypothetical protein [Desulfovibrio sp.]
MAGNKWLSIILLLAFVVWTMPDAAHAEVVEGIVGASYIRTSQGDVAYRDEGVPIPAKVHEVCAFGDLCRITGTVGSTLRIGPAFMHIEGVRRLSTAPRVPFDVTGRVRKTSKGYWTVWTTGGTPALYFMGASQAARRIAAACADGDICRVRGLGTKDEEDGCRVMPAVVQDVELIRRARLLTVEIVGTRGCGSMPVCYVIGDGDEYLEGLENFWDTPVDRKAPTCERSRVIALVHDTDPEQAVDLLAVGCARPYPDDIPAAVEGGPQ